jgi:hypothetical protein
VTGPLTDDLTTHVVQPDILSQDGRRRGSGMLPLVVVLVLLAAAILTGRRVTESGPTGSFSVLAAPPHALVAQLSTSGGMAGNTVTARLYPPVLAVYADGTAIANAATVLHLSRTEVAELVGGLRAQLAGFGPRVEMPAGARQVMDASDVTLGVYDDGRMRTVTGYALGADLGYPDRLVAAYDRLARVLRQALRATEPYRSGAVRLLVVPWVGVGPAAPPWPPAVPVPPVLPRDRLGVRQADLTGRAAAAVAATWPAPPGSGGVASHPAFTHRLPDGHVVLVQWRYLLPSEPRR